MGLVEDMGTAGQLGARGILTGRTGPGRLGSEFGEQVTDLGADPIRVGGFTGTGRSG